MRKLNKYFVYIFLIGFLMILGLMSKAWNQQNNTKLKSGKSQNRIVIGSVSCRQQNETKSNDETLVLMKSVLISAKMYGVRQVDFHLLLEYLEDSSFFRNSIKEFKIQNEIDVKLYFYSALDSVPEKYHEQMIYKAKFRCTYARLFFPRTLSNVDSILYMDTDIIVTGNIEDLWSNLFKMNDEQLIGVVANNEPETYPVKYKMHNCFKDVPFVQPKGLNAGLQLMNLTKMRQYGWEERVLRLFDDYSKIVSLDDQRLINILLFYDSGLLFLLPCQFNIRCSPCDHGFICKEASENFYGIQAVHGANGQFENGSRFHYIYYFYKKFDIAKDDIMQQLILPIRNFPEDRKSKRIGVKCQKRINHLLFKNWF